MRRKKVIPMRLENQGDTPVIGQSSNCSCFFKTGVDLGLSVIGRKVVLEASLCISSGNKVDWTKFR
jgi:hypothetical protein